MAGSGVFSGNDKAVAVLRSGGGGPEPDASPDGFDRPRKAERLP